MNLRRWLQSHSKPTSSRRRKSGARVEELEARALLAMTYGDFNGDSHVDLAIGSPQADVAGLINAGAVNIMYGTADGLSGSGSQEWTAHSPGLSHGAASGLTGIRQPALAQGCSGNVGDGRQF